MPLFFFAAGYLYRCKPVLNDVKQRFQSLIVPYFVFGIITLVYWQLVESHFRNQGLNFSKGLVGVILGYDTYLNFNSPLWFLPCFFTTVVIYNVLNKMIGKKLTFILTICVSMITMVISLPNIPWIWELHKTIGYIGFYALGTLSSDFKVDTIVSNKPRVLNITMSIILIGVNFILSYYGLNNGVMQHLTALVGITSMTIIALLIEHNETIEYLGRISLVILCVHGEIYRVFVKILSILTHIDTEVLRENFIIAMIIMVITLLICGFVYEVLVRIAPWMVGSTVKNISKTKQL
jgi:fucose 4-O-acetylase-like acetyltransferase